GIRDDINQAQNTIIKDLILSLDRKFVAEIAVLSQQIVQISQQVTQVSEQVSRVERQEIRTHELNAAIGRKLGLDEDILEGTRPPAIVGKRSRHPQLRGRVKSSLGEHQIRKVGVWTETGLLAVLLDKEQAEMVKTATKVYAATRPRKKSELLIKTRSKVSGGAKSQRWLDYIIKCIKDSKLMNEA
ncbi:MAG: hypothetical protein LQ349_007635, partial [Xanthoria aureola]